MEARLLARLGAEYLSLFNNGMSALVVACRALNLTGEVITTPFTFPATPHALVWNGLTPVFCDIDEQTLTLDVSAVQAAITERTSAVLGVYVYGMLCEVAGLDKVGKAHQLKILYDAAHAFGTDIDGRAVATYDDATMFSFPATKSLHTVEGGALVANDAATKYQVDLLKNFGIENETEVMLPGLNAKFNEVQLSIGLANLEYYDSE